MTPLLHGQRSISPQIPMPVEVIGMSSNVLQITAEPVSFIIASTNVASSGEAAGTVVYARLKNRQVLNSSGGMVGHKDDSSFSFVTGTILTTQKNPTLLGIDLEQFELDFSTNGTRALKMASIGSLLANGEYILFHRHGLIIGKKATTGNSDTATYKTRVGAGMSLQYLSAAPTLTSGDFNVPLADVSGNLMVTLGTKIAGEDLAANRMMVEHAYSGVRYTSDQLVKTGAGFLHAVTFGGTDAVPTAGSIIFYDNTAESGTVIFSENITTTPFQAYTVILDVAFSTGLYIGFTTTADVGVTPSWR